MKQFIFATALMLTLLSCRKEHDKSDNSTDFGIHPYSEQLNAPPGWSCIKDDDHNLFSFTSAIGLDENENVWIGGDNMLRKYEKNNTFVEYKEMSSMLAGYAGISTIIKDNSNDLWIGSNTVSGTPDSISRRGIIKFDGTSLTQYKESNSGLHNGLIFSIAIDNINNKWIGTKNSLVKFDGTSWSFYDSTNSPLKEFYPIVSFNSYISVGGHKSLTTFNGNAWKTFNQSNANFPASGIRIIDKDNSGNLWFVGYFSTTLWKFDGVNFTSYAIPAELPLNPDFGNFTDGEEYYAIKVDNQNNIWLGGYGKLIKYDGTNWKNFSAPTFVPGGDPRLPWVGKLKITTIRGIVIKADKTVWVASSVFPLMTFKE